MSGAVASMAVTSGRQRTTMPVSKTWKLTPWCATDALSARSLVSWILPSRRRARKDLVIHPWYREEVIEYLHRNNGINQTGIQGPPGRKRAP